MTAGQVLVSIAAAAAIAIGLASLLSPVLTHIQTVTLSGIAGGILGPALVMLVADR